VLPLKPARGGRTAPAAPPPPADPAPADSAVHLSK